MHITKQTVVVLELSEEEAGKLRSEMGSSESSFSQTLWDALVDAGIVAVDSE